MARGLHPTSYAERQHQERMAPAIEAAADNEQRYIAAERRVAELEAHAEKQLNDYRTIARDLTAQMKRAEAAEQLLEDIGSHAERAFIRQAGAPKTQQSKALWIIRQKARAALSRPHSECSQAEESA
jgi:hypothetical protein